MKQPQLKLRGVEAARGIAAMLVVALHITAILALPSTYGTRVFGGFFLFGRAGADFFFVLSGFIIALVHSADIGQPRQVPAYASRRLWRIYPIYLLVSLFYQALLFISPSREGAERVWSHVLMGWALIPEAAIPVLEVGWSLRHEMLFYTLFGLLLLHRRLGQTVLAAWGLGIAWNGLTFVLTGSWYFTGAWHLVVFRIFNLEFFFGMAVAMLCRRPAWRPVTLLVAGTALFLLNGMTESFGPPAHEWPPLHLTYALASAMALYGLAMLDGGGQLAVPRWLVEIGGASYSIYLVHVPVALLLGYGLRLLGPAIPIPLEAAFAILLTLAVTAGLLLSWLVEQPLLRWSRKHTPARRSPEQAFSVLSSDDDQ